MALTIVDMRVLVVAPMRVRKEGEGGTTVSTHFIMIMWGFTLASHASDPFRLLQCCGGGPGDGPA